MIGQYIVAAVIGICTGTVSVRVTLAIIKTKLHYIERDIERNRSNIVELFRIVK